MKDRKMFLICLFTAGCIFLNVGGRFLNDALKLPFWLDSFGTVLCAYALGPICGALVGLTSNVLHSSVDPISWLYGLTSIALALIIGYGAKRKLLNSFAGAMSAATLATFVAVVVSVPLNLLFNKGYTGNFYGDAVISYLTELEVPRGICAVIGQFYVDFLDKLVTVLLFYLILFFLKSRGNTLRVWWHTNVAQGGKNIFLFAVTTCLLVHLFSGDAIAAQQREEVDAYSNYVQTIYSSNNGLPCGEANDIAQTNDGILWIATYAGLYRYNGKEFRWMDTMNSVRNANCLYVDQEGRLWIGTNDNGLAIAINEEIVNVIDEDDGLPSNSVRSIIQAADGYYYIGTTGSMQIMTLNSGLKKVGSLVEMNYTDNIAADERGFVAAVTADGRLFLLREGEILSSLRFIEEGEDFNCCGFDSSGNLIVGTTGNRLLFYDITQGCFLLLKERQCEGLLNINDLYFPGNGEMFVSADNGVGYLDAGGAYHKVNTNNFNNSIDNMLMDYQGNLWFTSSRLGLLRLAASSFRDIYSTVGMAKRVVNTVEKWQGKLYFGTDKGLDAVDETCRMQLQDDLTERLQGVRIRCLLVDSKNNLWICTYGKGLMKAEENGTVTVYSSENGSFGNKARTVKELSDGTILAAGDTGISFIRDGVVTKTIGHTDGLINSMILTVTELSDGRILAGTDGDGIAVIENGEVAQMLTRKDGLSSEVILRTFKDTKSEGVFLVTSNGLCFLDEDMTIRQMDKFPYFNNYDIWAVDQDTLFVMSSAGIYVVSRDELLSEDQELHYELLDAKKGLNTALTANSWSYCDEQDNLYLPCDTGVFVINTNAYVTELPLYRISIPYVKMDNLGYRQPKNTAIEAGTGVNRIELYPEVINYSVQIPTVGYYLEGFDTEWTKLPQSSLNAIVYTNLPAGEYVLHLAIFDSEEKNIVTERLFPLSKSQEFYETELFSFYFFGVIVLAAVYITALIAYRGYANLKQKAEMGNQTIIAIARTVDAKDQRTKQHSDRVSRYAVLIARAMGLSDKDCENIRKAALMHDIGKIGIPDSILNKPARLTDEEYSVMKTHTTFGGEILKDMTLIDHVAEGAVYHHERYDGRGYPRGLKGEEIPLYARIIGVADAFDAMTANRVYRSQMDLDYVVNEMRKGRGTQFDPHVDDVFLKLVEDGTIDLNLIYGSEKKEASAE